jgi:hypothetical protein
MHGVNADQYITDGRQAWYDVALVLVPEIETLAGPFEFIKEINKEVDIELSSEIANKLIEQMAVAIIRVTKKRKTKNDDLANK